MERAYYYFTTGLPDLIMEGGRSLPTLQTFFEEAADLLHPDDLELLKILRFPFDALNLTMVLNKRNASFDERAFFTRTELEQEIKTPEHLPECMQQFIAAFKDNRDIVAELNRDDQLQWLLYEEFCAYPVDFIAEWFTFERDLRNIVTALRCRASRHENPESGEPCDLNKIIIGRSEVSEAILRSSASDFGLSAAAPWIERLISAPPDDIVAQEQIIDQIRWDKLDEQMAVAPFGAASVCAFQIRLGMALRWQTLDTERGRLFFDQLLEGLIRKISQ